MSLLFVKCLSINIKTVKILQYTVRINFVIGLEAINNLLDSLPDFFIQWRAPWWSVVVIHHQRERSYAVFLQVEWIPTLADCRSYISIHVVRAWARALDVSPRNRVTFRLNIQSNIVTVL